MGSFYMGQSKKVDTQYIRNIKPTIAALKTKIQKKVSQNFSLTFLIKDMGQIYSTFQSYI